MAIRKALWPLGCGLVLISAMYAFQRPFRQYRGVEYRRFELPPDWQEKTEWAFARLMFPPGWNDGYRGRFDGDWRLGLSLWTQDYPRADRHFSGGPAADPHPCPLGGATHQPGRWRRCIQLALALCRAGGRMGVDPGAGQGAA